MYKISVIDQDDPHGLPYEYESNSLVEVAAELIRLSNQGVKSDQLTLSTER